MGGAPRQLAITPDGSTAYVANMGSASVTPINTTTNTAATAIAVPCVGPDAAAVDPANSTLYVTCFGATGINPASYGAVVLHVAPEAAVGGPLGLVRDGDWITLDVPGRGLRLEVDDDELARRRADWTPPPSVTATRSDG